MRKLLWLIAVTAIESIASCSRLTHGDAMSYNSAIPDTLRVGTLYSPTSFFLFRGDTMGYEYDRICSFAQAKGVATEFIIASHRCHCLRSAHHKRISQTGAQLR